MYWIIAALVAIFGLALLGRRRPGAWRPLRFQQPVEPDIRPLRPGEVYDEPVKLTTFPNVPLAELWVQRLKEQGIEAFTKAGVPLAGTYGTLMDQTLPAEVWVGEHDAERAAQLLRELG